MKLPDDVRERFRSFGRAGGRKRAARMSPAARRAVARKAAVARWVRKRFGAPSFEDLGFPGGALVDAGLAALAEDRVTVESLVVSLASPRLRRERVPVRRAIDNPVDRLFDLLEHTAGDLAHARYNAHLRQISSFADACRSARLARSFRHAP